MDTPAPSRPAAYLRRSYVDLNSPGDISREAQRATVRKLAEADGSNGDLIEYDDWGVSADVAKSAKRTDYARLLSDMEAGRVSAVYAFDVDRLYRDPRDLIRLQDAAQHHAVRIVTTSGVLAIGDGDDPAAEAFAFVGSVFGAMELKKIKKRNRAARDARLKRGDTLGRPPFGYVMHRDESGRVVHVRDPQQPLEAVLEAFAEAGSFNGAARLLNASNVAAPRGGSWAGNVVNRIVRREKPGTVPRGRSEARVAPRGTHLFSRLLRCQCGRFLTPRVSTTRTKYGTFGPYVGYQCYAGRHDPAHPRPYMVAESGIIDWAKAEAARLQTPDRVQLAQHHHQQRRELEEQRRRLGWAVADGLLEREDAQDRARAIAEELDRLAKQESAIVIPAVDWSWPVAELNTVLRAIWEYVQLGPDMRARGAVWRVPEWRA